MGDSKHCYPGTDVLINKLKEIIEKSKLRERDDDYCR